MNHLIVVAQANGPQGPNGTPGKTVVVNKPQGEQSITIHLDGATKLDLSAIASEQITLVHLGDRLIILFDNHAQVTIDPFYGDNGQPLADLTVELGPGRDVSSSDFAGLFPITTDATVLPASGGPGAPSSGANFVPFSIDALSVPGPLPLLGPESFGSTFTEVTGGPLHEQTINVISLTGNSLTGDAFEGGLITDSIGTVGNHPGEPTVVSGGPGTLNTLVDFGPVGPGATPFQFVSTASAEAFLSGLGLTSQGMAVDHVTIIGNTLTAGTDPTQTGQPSNDPNPHDVFSLVINPDGSITFTLLGPLDDANPGHLTPGAAVLDQFTVDLSGFIQAVDAQGNTLTLSHDVFVNVHDDAPALIATLPTEDGLANNFVGGSVEESALTSATPGEPFGSGTPDDFFGRDTPDELLGSGTPGDLFGSGSGGGTTTVSGDLNTLVAFGADGPDFDLVTQTYDGFQLVSQANATSWLHGLNLTSHGQAIDFVEISGDTMTAWTGGGPGDQGAHEVFSFTLNGDGTFSFTLINPLDHPDPGHDSPSTPGIHDTILVDMSGFVQAVDFDGDAVTLSGDFAISIVDDIPQQQFIDEGSGGFVITVDEGGLASGTVGSSPPGDLFGSGNDTDTGAPTSQGGTFSGTFRFGADGPDIVNGNTAAYQIAPGNNSVVHLGIMSHGQEVDFVTVTNNPAGPDGTSQTLIAWAGGDPAENPNAHEVFSLTVDGDGSFTFQLINPVDHPDPGQATPGQAVEDTFPLDLSSLVAGVDFDGDAVPMVSGTFVVDIIDDVPVAQGNLVQNGDFSAGNFAPQVFNGFTFGVALPGDPQLGWTVSASDVNGASKVELERVPSGYDPFNDGGVYMPDGHFLADMEASPGDIKISQVVHNVVDGQAYSLEFFAGAGLPLTPGSDELLVFWGSQQVADIIPGSTPTPYLFGVTGGANDAANTLTFEEIGASGDFIGTYVADVAIEAGTPFGIVDEGALASGSLGDQFGTGNDLGNPSAATIASGTLAGLVSFGADGPAAVDLASTKPSGGFQIDPSTAQGVIAGLGLTSHDQKVDVVDVTIANGVETLTASTSGGPDGEPGHEVFKLTLDESTGAWTFTLVNPLDNPPPPAGVGEDSSILDLSGLVQAVDFDGDAVPLQSGSFKVDVIDDVPVLVAGASASAGHVDEGGLDKAISFLGFHFGTDLYGDGNDPHAPTVVTGTLSGLVSFGADGAESGTFTATGSNSHDHDHDRDDPPPTTLTQTIADGFHFVSTDAAQTWLEGLNGAKGFTSHGQEIDVVSVSEATSIVNGAVVETETLTASTAGPNGHAVFEIDLNVTTGAWTFTLLNPIDDPNGQGENSVTLDLSGLVKAVDFDGDAVTLAGDFSITVKDDVPELAPFAFSVGHVDEGALHLSASGGDLYGDGNDQGPHDFASVTDSGSLAKLVSFGADGPAADAFEFVGQDAATTWLAGLKLTSHGEKVDIASFSTDSNGNPVLIASAAGDGHTVFTLTLDEITGHWIFTLVNPIDQAPDHGENTRTIDLSGFVQAVDFDGDPITLANDFGVVVTDDKPELTSARDTSGSVDEGALTFSATGKGDLYGDGNDHHVSGASASIGGSIANLVSLGADGPAIDSHGGNDGFQFAVDNKSTFDFHVKSHDQEVNFVTLSGVSEDASHGAAQTLTAWTDGGGKDGHAVFTLTLYGDGTYTFTLINPIDQPAQGEDSLTLDLSRLIQAVDFDGDAVTLSNDFKIKVVDDMPELVSGTVSSGRVDEGGLDQVHDQHGTDLYGDGNDPFLPTTTGGTLSGLVSFGADGAETGTFTATGSDSHDHDHDHDDRPTTLTQTIADGFHFVSTDAAQTWLEGLNGAKGFTSHGQEIDVVSVSEATSIVNGAVVETETLTASTAGPNGHAVFEIDLNVTTGAWTFTLLNPIDDPNGQGENSVTLDLSGLVKAVDFDGDAVTLAGDFSITVKDDVPELTPSAFSVANVDEGALHVSTSVGDLYGDGNDQGPHDFASATDSGSLAKLVSFGADGPAVDGDGGKDGFQFAVSDHSTFNFHVKSHGQEVNFVTLSAVSEAPLHGAAQTLTAWTDGGGDGSHEVFTLTLYGDGSYTFTLINPIDQAADNGENSKVIDLSGLIQAVDFDGDAVTLANDFTVVVTDDKPELTSARDTSGSVDEGALTFSATGKGDLFGDGNDHSVSSASASVSGSIANLVSLGADGPAIDSHHGNDGFQFAVDNKSTFDFHVKSHGQEVNFVTLSGVSEDPLHGASQTLTAWTDGGGKNGHEVFTLTLNGDGTYTFTLINPLDDPTGNDENSLTLDLSRLVQAVDFDGDAVTLASDFKITVIDDVPVLVAQTPVTIIDGSFHGNMAGGTGDFPNLGGWGGPDGAYDTKGSIDGGAWTYSASPVGPGDTVQLERVGSGYAGATSSNTAPMIDLEASPGNIEISQTIDGLTNGEKIELNFEIGEANFGNARLAVLWGGQQVATYDPQSGPTQLESLVVTATGTSGTVTFEEIGQSGDNTGTYLTNVSAQQVAGVVDEGGLNVPAINLPGPFPNASVTQLPIVGNDHGAPTSASGSLAGLVHFGADGPAAGGGFSFVPQSSSAAATLVGDMHLVSLGSAVNQATLSGDGHTITASAADGHDVFTLTVNPDGSWSFNLLAPLDDAHVGEDVMNLDFSSFVQATDFDGDFVTLSGDFTVAVIDDVPVVTAAADVGNVDEHGLPSDENPGGAPFATGSLHVAWGADDGAAESLAFAVDGSGHPIGAVDAHGQPLTLTSDGRALAYEIVAGPEHGPELIAYYQGSPPPDPQHNIGIDNIVFAVTLYVPGGENDAFYAFSLFHPLDQDGPGGTLPLNFAITARDSDGDPVQETITVNVKDDAPVAGTNALVQLDDDTMPGGNPDGVNDVLPHTANTAGTLAHEYGADGPGTVALTGIVLSTGLDFSSTVSNGVVTVQQHGVDVLSITLNDAVAGTYTVTQLAAIDHPPGGGENDIQFALNYQVTDHDGSTASGTMAIDVKDDVPVIPVEPANLIQNPSFEAGHTDIDTGNGQWSIYESLPGWTSGPDHVPFEVQVGTGPVGPGSIGGIGAEDGSAKVELDSDTGGGNDPFNTNPSPTHSTNATIEQTVATVQGETYELTFWYSPRAEVVGTDSSSMNVLWNGQVVQSIDSTHLQVGWNQITLFVEATGASSTLAFQGTGNEDTLGALIDNVSLSAMGVVDEDGLPSGNHDSQLGDIVVPDTDGDHNEATTTVSLDVQWGADNRDGGLDHLDANGSFVQDGSGRSLQFTDNSITLGGVTALTSNGVQVVTALSADHTVLTGTANGVEVFQVSLSDDGTGAYRFVLTGNLDQAAGGAENNLTLGFNYTATDADGDTATGTFTVMVNDDSPVAVADTNEVESGATASGNVLANDRIGADRGVLGVNAHVSYVASDNLPADFGAIVAGGGATVIGQFGTLTIDADGTYHYVANSNTQGTDVFSYTLVDGDGDASIATLSIQVDNGQPHPMPASGTVDEAGLSTGSNPSSTAIVASDTLNLGGGDAPHVTLISGATSSSVDPSLGATVNGQYGTLHIDQSGHYTYTLTSNDPHHTSQGTGADGQADVFTYTVTDAFGNTSTSTITIAIKDDVPTAVNDSASTTEGTSISSNVLSNDTLGADRGTIGIDERVLSVAHGATTDTINAGSAATITGDYGKLTLNADGSYTYAANANLSDNPTPLHDTFTYMMADADGDTSSATLDIAVSDGPAPSVSGSISLTVNEAALDTSKDHNDLAAGLVTGSNPSSTAETQVQTGITFTAGSDNITGVAFDLTGPIQITGAASGSQFFWTVNGSGQLEGHLGTSASGPLAIILQIGGQTTASVGGSAAINVTATLTDAFPHAPGNGTNSITISGIGVVATDSDGTRSAPGSISVTVVDDIPTAANDSKSVNEGSGLANVVLVLDTSGSIDHDEFTLEKSAAINLLNNGHVNQVMVVDFAGNAETSGWLSAANAITYINGLQTGGDTNYHKALQEVESHFADTHTSASQTVGYFISDGDPNQPPGSADISSSEESTWTSFLSTNGIGTFYGVHLESSSPASTLAPIAYPNDAVDNIGLTSNTGLLSTFPSLANTVHDNVLTNDHFGADGGRILSVTVAGTTYTWDGSHTISEAGTLQGTYSNNATSISVATALGGHFDFFFAADGSGHNAGDWDYSAPSSLASTQTENFGYALIDGDGDTASATIAVTVDVPVAAADSFAVTEANVMNAKSSSPLIAGNVTTNDSDVDGDALTVTSITQPTVVESDTQVSISSITATTAGIGEVARYVIVTNTGTMDLAVTATGNVELWTTNGDPWQGLGVNETANINFNYTISDGHGGSATAAATVTVNGSNDPPTLSGGATLNLSIPENTTAVTTIGGSDPDGDVLTYSIVNTSGTDFAKFSINANTGALSFTAAPNFEAPTDIGGSHAGDNIYVVNVQAADEHGGTAQQTVNVTVTNVNEAPDLQPNAPAAISYTENGSPVALMPTATVTDPDNPASFNGGSIDVKLNNPVTGDQLSLLTGSNGVGISGTTVSVNGFNVGTISGLGTTHETIAFNSNNAIDPRIETLLQALAYSSSSDNPTDADRTATVTFSDGGNTGSGGALTDSATVTVHVTPVDDPPVNTVPGAQSTAENTSLVFSSGHGNLISVSDVDSTNLTVTLTDVNGTLTLSGTSGLTVTGNGTNDVVLSGTQSSIDAALSGLTYAPKSNTTGSDTLTVTTSDGTHSDTDTVAITVTPPPDTITTNNVTIAADTTQNFLVNSAGPEATDNHFSIPVLSLLQNDSSTAGGNPLTMTVTNVSSGTSGVSLTADHDYVLFPFLTLHNGAASGTFTITISDGTATATETVTVNEQSSFGIGTESGTNGNDFIIENAQFFFGNVTLQGLDGNDNLIVNSGDSTVYGYNQTGGNSSNSGGNDLLIGDVGSTLNAGAGNDTLWIQGGNGDLFGNTVAGKTTTFYFQSPNDAGDHNGNNASAIHNFDSANNQNDVIAVSAAGFGGSLTVGTLPGSEFTTTGFGTGNHTTNERFFFDSSSHQLWYSANGSTNSEILLATVTNHTVTANDIHVVA